MKIIFLKIFYIYNTMKYKKILLGIRTFSSCWLLSIKKINQPNIILCDFDNELEKTIEINNIDYIIPLSKQDYDIVKKTIYKDKILYPSEENIELLNNKLNFTKFMLKEFENFIPKVYYLKNNIIEKNILFPLISKPIFSTNGLNMRIIKNNNELNMCKNKMIIQEYIDFDYEYSAFFLCIEGKIINIKILKKIFPKYHIKKSNFVDYIEVNDFPIEILEELTIKLKYTGGGNIDFKYNETNKKIYIFEFNPRFGGSAFTNDFIYELLCIEN